MYYLERVSVLKQILVAARSKAWFYGLSLTAVAGSNPAGGIDVLLLRVLCVVKKRSLRRVDHSSRGGLGPLGVVEPRGGKKSFKMLKAGYQER